MAVERPRRTALVLSAGGSWGAVQVGMVHALVEAGVGWDCIVGTSVGALNGAFLAGERGARALPQLTRAWHDADGARLFWPAPVVGLGALLGTRDAVFRSRPLERWILRFLKFDRLEDAAQDLHVVATDLLTGQELRYDEGPALPLLMATSAIPGLLPPVELGGRVLVDGAIGAYTPVRAAADLGCTELIVLSTHTPRVALERPRGALNITMQALNHVMTAQLRADLAALAHARRDIAVRLVPAPVELRSAPGDFGAAEMLIDAARQAARAWIADGGLTRDGAPAVVLEETFGAWQG